MEAQYYEKRKLASFFSAAEDGKSAGGINGTEAGETMSHTNARELPKAAFEEEEKDGMCASSWLG